MITLDHALIGHGEEMDRTTKSDYPSMFFKKRGTVIIRFLGAIICLVVAIISWIILAEKLQGLLKSFNQPYFMVFWIHSWYAILYVIWKAWREFPGGCQCNRVGDGFLSWKRAFWSSGIIGLVGLISAYLWYLSLPHTSVPANTSIYQSAVAFTFVMSVPILREKVTVVKVLAVLFAIAGVVLISLYSENEKNAGIQQTPLGYIYLVVSTILYALMEVLFKKLASFKDDPASVCNGMRFVGLMGIHTFVWMWPPLVILHFTGLEVFKFPDLDVLWMVFLNAILDVCFNGAVFMCVALSSPLFATIGTVTAIPLSIMVDYIIKRTTSSVFVYIGMVLIGIGFIGFCTSEFLHIRQESATQDTLSTDEVDNGALPISINESSKETDPLLSNGVTSRNKYLFKYYLLKYII